MILYHRTDRAEAILSDGFRDGRGKYMTETGHEGVRVSERPLDANEGAWGNRVLAIDCPLSDDELAAFEWVEEGKGHREWLIPAAILNERCTVSLFEDGS